jgi:hypothetical protein
MRRYVILEHDHPVLHWDLMLEAGDVLRTWRLAAAPQPGRPVAAEPIGDHRPIYLEYQGQVSGNRGTVRRWDRGEYRPALEEATRADGAVVLILTGEKLRGTAILSSRDGGQWTFGVGGDADHGP